jgi:3-hydroxybutyryl-CoA dehydrogenase
MTFSNIGVVGCGLMGSGIAEVCARSGAEVTVLEVDPDTLAAGAARIEKSLERALRANKVSQEQRSDAMARITFSEDMGDLAQSELVIEAIIENEDEKTRVFAELDKVCQRPDVVLASNTSSIPIMKLAMSTSRPERVIGVHFFNPVPVMGLVELVTSLLSGPEAVDRAADFAEHQLGKRVIRSQDRAGFVVNALLVPYILSAIRMMESGFASAEDIEAGMVLGCNHPMGPLALADLIGLDTTMAMAESLYAEFKEPLYAPPPLLARMVDAGLLGRKAGRGFHSYA